MFLFCKLLLHLKVLESSCLITTFHCFILQQIPSLLLLSFANFIPRYLKKHYLLQCARIYCNTNFFASHNQVFNFSNIYVEVPRSEFFMKFSDHVSGVLFVQCYQNLIILKQVRVEIVVIY